MNPSPPPVSPRRPRDAEATRAALLRAARRRFTVLGYERTTTRDIAADAGVNVSLISRYFGSKDGLFAAVVEESSDVLDDGSDLAPDAIVESMIASLAPDAWAEFGHEHPLLLLIRGSGAGEERVSGLRQEALIAVIDRLRRSWADPSLDPATAQLRAELLFALFSGVTLLRSLVPGEPLITRDVDLLRTELERLVRAIVGSADG
ncbi:MULTISPECIES: TetR/AcrR family transcriptional regulator [unclassified Nocardioides]|uniref:TetR/AcrR family transcriptional regulator n=1 Tax=unclassified Nocardioides TaxID=2615069 RepID=UPI0030153D02